MKKFITILVSLLGTSAMAEEDTYSNLNTGSLSAACEFVDAQVGELSFYPDQTSMRGGRFSTDIRQVITMNFHGISQVIIETSKNQSGQPILTQLGPSNDDLNANGNLIDNIDLRPIGGGGSITQEAQGDRLVFTPDQTTNHGVPVQYVHQGFEFDIDVDMSNDFIAESFSIYRIYFDITCVE